MDFLNGCQRVVNYWFFYCGYSIGIGDIIFDDKIIEFIEKYINDEKVVVVKFIKMVIENQFEVFLGMNVCEMFENKVLVVLNMVCDKVGMFIEKSLKDFNNVVIMVCLGFKGFFINIF